jgi:hypothetical protein
VILKSGNFNVATREGETPAGNYRGLSCLWQQVFPNLSIRHEVRGFFMPVAEVENGAEKEPEKNLRAGGRKGTFAGGKKENQKINNEKADSRKRR